MTAAFVGLAFAGVELIGGTDGSGESASSEINDATLVSSVEPVAVAAPAWIEHDVPGGLLFQNVIRTDRGDVRLGHLFAARRGERGPATLVGALRTLGPAGGLPEPIGALDVFAAVRSVALLDTVTGRVLSQTPGRPLIIPGAKALPAESAHGDVLAFRPASGAGFSPLTLAREIPEVDDPIWVPVGDAFVPGHVVNNRQGRLLIELDESVDDEFDVGKLIGIPVINTDGDVAGVVSYGQTRQSHCRMLASPSANFAEYF